MGHVLSYKQFIIQYDTINFSQEKQIYVFGYLLMQRICISIK